MKFFLPIFMISMVMGSPFLRGSSGQNRLELENQIWRLEEAYWENWIKGDLEGCMSLLHEGFIGWPSSAEKPRDKNAARKFVQDYVDQTKPFAFEIKPSAISIRTDTAVVYYSLTWKDKDGKQTGDSHRITHTWIKREDTWKVLGGMSSVIDED